MNRSTILLSMLTLSVAARAAAAGVGTSGGDFLSVGIGARQLAMGGAAAALDSGIDANAVNWNPGALGLIDKANVSASYNSLFQDENQGFFGYAAPAGKGGGVWAAGLNYLVVSNIQARAGDTENADSTFSNQNFAVSGSYSKKVGEAASVGGTVKYVREYIPGLSANAMAVDFGAVYRTPVKGLSAGAAVRNLGTKLGPDNLPLTLDGGAAYKLFDDKLVLASDLDWLVNEKTAYFNVGGEAWINRILAARAGYQFGHGADQLQNSMVGMGIGLGLKVDHFTLDYAFLPYGDLGNTHRITLGFRFE